VVARSWRLAAWFAALGAGAALWSWSFSSFPGIDRKHSVLADADAANFKVLLEEFRLDRKFGNEYNAQQRSVGDNAQKHKIHHLLYPLVGHPVYLAARAAWAGLGFDATRAAYSVNAVITALNLVLLALLLRGPPARPGPIWPFLALYAFSLSTWLYASVPESWPLSGTIVLLFVLGLERGLPQLGLAALLGIGMLNNMTLLALLGLVWLRQLSAGEPPLRVAGRAAALLAVAVGTWLGALWLLSFFDPSLHPANLVRYTLWFKQFVSGGASALSLYAFKSALSGLFLSSVTSRQPDPTVPQESALYTLQGGGLGALALVMVALLLLLLAVRAVQGARARQAADRNWLARLDDPELRPLAWCAAMAVVTIVMYFAAGFLYSTTVVPLLALACRRNLDWQRRTDRAVVLVALLLVVVNNAMQVVEFRMALAAQS
jgi:hypothetical protein